MNSKFLWRLLSLLTVFAMMASLALVRNGRLMGRDLTAPPEGETDTTAVVATTPEGGLVVNTTEPGKDISGYAGAVPLKIHISGGKVDSVTALPNQETPGFFNRVRDKGLLDAWNGMTVAEAAVYTPDAVSGATFSSNAVIGNVRVGLEKALAHDGTVAQNDGVISEAEGWSVRATLALIVVLMAAVIPMFVHSRLMRTVQQLLNVGVLGFWTGTFIDFTNVLRFTSEGLTYSAASITTLLILIIGFIYPLLGKGTYYCANVCPLGSLQELAGHLSPRKLTMGQRSVRFLNGFREVLFCILILLLWIGWGAEWIDYELFTAFIVESAAWSVIAVGLAFVVLSVFIPRPFCRFVCPTGTLLKLPTGLRAGGTGKNTANKSK